MPDLSKRIFGSSIDAKIQLKLKARQQVAEFGVGVDTIKHNNQTYSVRDVLGKDNLKVTELGSRTPWARMWCAVEIYRPEKKPSYPTVKRDDLAGITGATFVNRDRNLKEQSLGTKIYVLGDNNFNQFKSNNIYDSIENNNHTSKNPSESQSVNSIE